MSNRHGSQDLRGRAAGDPEEDLARWLGTRQKHHSEYVKLLNERKNELLALQIDHGPRSDIYRNAKRELDRTDSQFERYHAVLRRPLNKFAMAPWAFWLFALALAVFEAPINKFLFDYAIQGTNLTSYVISTVFAVLLLLLAHMCGKCIRQIWSEYRRRVVWSNIIIAIIGIVVLAFLISILTIGRARYSAGAADPGLGDLFGEIGGKVGELGFFGSLGEAFSDTSALILFTVNLGGALAVLLLGFFSHEPDRDFGRRQCAEAKQQGDRQAAEEICPVARQDDRRFAPDLRAPAATMPNPTTASSRSNRCSTCRSTTPTCSSSIPWTISPPKPRRTRRAPPANHIPRSPRTWPNGSLSGRRRG